PHCCSNLFFFHSSPHHHHLHSFPTRRSSDLKSTARSPPRAMGRLSARTVSRASSRLRWSSRSPPTRTLSGSRRWHRRRRARRLRSEEHTSELQSRGHLVCRLLLEKKKKKTNT